MHLRSPALLALLLLAACAGPRPVPPPLPPAAPGAAPLFLWKVTPTDGAPGSLHLQGAVHIERDAQPRLDRAALAALEAADEAVVEVELTPAATARLLGATQERGTLPEGETLAGTLSPETQALLVARCEALGLSAKLFERMRPWLAALSLPVLEMRLAGFGEEGGVDRFVARRARERAKPVRSLETVESQIELFAGLSPALQEGLLRGALRQSAVGAEALALFEAFRAGDVAAMEETVFAQLRAEPEQAEVYERLFFARNRAMAEALRSLLLEPKRYFVAVGAGHVVGERGLVSLFERAGYRVERVAPQGVEEPAAAGPRAWIPIVDEALGFRFELPAEPQIRPPPGGAAGAATTYVLDQGILAFAVAATPVPALSQGLDERLLIGMASEGAVLQAGGKIEVAEEARFAGVAARRVRFAMPGGRGENLFFVRDGALYVVGAVHLGKTRGEDPRVAQTKRFFESFSPLPSPTPAP